MGTNSYSKQAVKPDIKDQVQHLLEELKIIMPGSQILLSFQLTSVFATGFEKLSSSLKYTHLVSILFTILAIAFVMFNTSFHRIVNAGKDSTQFHAYGSYMLIASLVTMTIALVLDLYAVSYVITKISFISLLLSACMLVFIYFLWFILPFYIKKFVNDWIG
jgi:hypothetical protein